MLCIGDRVQIISRAVMKAVVQHVTRCFIICLLPEQILDLRSMSIVADGATWSRMIVIEGGRRRVEVVGIV